MCWRGWPEYLIPVSIYVLNKQALVSCQCNDKLQCKLQPFVPVITNIKLYGCTAGQMSINSSIQNKWSFLNKHYNFNILIFVASIVYMLVVSLGSLDLTRALCADHFLKVLGFLLLIGSNVLHEGQHCHSHKDSLQGPYAAAADDKLYMLNWFLPTGCHSITYCMCDLPLPIHSLFS